MKLNIKATGIDLTPALRAYIEEKIGSVAKFIKRWDDTGAVEARVEVARTTKHHHKGDVFYAEVNVHLPGKVVRAEGTDADMRAAIDRVRDTLRREVEKYKELMEQKREP